MCAKMNNKTKTDFTSHTERTIKARSLLDSNRNDLGYWSEKVSLYWLRLKGHYYRDNGILKLLNLIYLLFEVFVEQ